MYKPFTIGYKYLKYLLKASNGKGHGIHSPFVYNFIEKVLNDKTVYHEYKPIEVLRRQLRRSRQTVQVRDLGAGSVNGNTSIRKISTIARLSAKSPKFAQLLFRIIRYYRPGSVVELGTSLGLTTAYLASAAGTEQVITLEGAPEIAAIARNNFNTLAIKNVSVINGDFKNTLGSVIVETPKAGMIFFDGNHRYEPTLDYFNTALIKISPETIFVFDDIHWSGEMEAAWEEIKANPAVTCSIDLFFIGLVFFNPDFKQKQHFTIRF